MTIDEIKGKLSGLQRAKANPEVQFWLKTLEELADNLLVQDYNAGGEAAVRALGVQKGIGMCLTLDKIYESSVNAVASSQIIKPR